jgi:hypothetical protein
MPKKAKKTNWKEFIKEFSDEILYLKNYDSWKDDFLGLYGYVWCRWYQDVPKPKIIEDLNNLVAENECKNRSGIISVKITDDHKLKLTFKSKKKEKAWQKILFSRLLEKNNITIAKDLNVSLELELTEEEKGIVENEIAFTKRLQINNK